MRDVDVFAGCTHASLHYHGSATTYQKHRCRCAPCSAAQSRYAKTRRHAREHGQALYIDPTRARAHVEMLLRRGLTIPQVARRAGIDRETVRALVGQTPGGVPSTWTHRATEARLLSVYPEAIGPEQIGLVHPAGTARRLQALAARGWSRTQIGRRLGTTRQAVRELMDPARSQISVQSRTKVAALYDELWNVDPQPSTPAERSAYTKTLAEAVRKGWPPPLAWDDDTIDHPGAQPWVDAPEPKRNGPHRRVVIEDVEDLLHFGVARAEIESRLGVGSGTLQKSLTYADRVDLWHRVRDAEQQRREAA